ncbi:hypothetical protein GGR21_002572 [Dysgonomonas hofstadii]|uniref:Uncharacterized protein n=1 Tax=Dysgonomonas hofstadii TaxID=637886 RepID=A0A840CMP5_9BACT|nr:hypothetical protein [Dysgonomonas hofstadii]MBB4036666.1 hypothetical protein [Dysgonomonas hofstadii]
MKTKLQILLFFILCFFMMGSIVHLKAESIETITTSSVPSEEYLKSAEDYLKSEKASIAVSSRYDVLRAPQGLLRAADLWEDPTMPFTDSSGEGNVGAPIASATLPIVFSIFVIYLIYRTTTTSRRKNNF